MNEPAFDSADDPGPLDPTLLEPQDMEAVRGKVAKLLSRVHARLEDPNTARTSAPWLFWCMFLDAKYMFEEATGRDAECVYLPEAMAEMLQMYADSELPEACDVRKQLAGLRVSTNTTRFWFA
jgi:hypothetical protein